MFSSLGHTLNFFFTILTASAFSLAIEPRSSQRYPRSRNLFSSLSSTKKSEDSFISENILEVRTGLMMEAISKSYDSFIIDQWGVLHDGKTPYPGVVECLEKLKADAKRLILLSNSSKRKASSFKGLNKVGINSLLFDDIVTSGEMAWNDILNRKFDFVLPPEASTSSSKSETADIPSMKSTGADSSATQISSNIPDRKLRVFVVGNNDDDADYITSCNCIASPPESADFVLARGTFCIITGNDPTTSPATSEPQDESKTQDNCVISFKNAEDLIAAIDPYLARCRVRGLPMLVSNPDFHRPGSGAPMPGQIGRKYSELGGTVQYIGKPYSAVYDACMSVLAVRDTTSDVAGEIDRTRVCGVGDSLDHDILGAKKAGIASVWTSNGVHSGEMGTEEGSPVLAPKNILESMYVRYGVTPSHTVAAFKW